MSLRQYYQIYCVTESTLVYEWSTIIPTTCPNNATHTIGTVVCIDPNPPISPLYDVVVDASGNGNYTSIAEAFANGFVNVFVKNGTYTETSDIMIPDRGRLIGQSPGAVVVILLNGSSIKIDGSGGVAQTAGTISMTNNSKAITGSGTSFTSLNVGDYILVGNNYMQIASIASDTSLQLVNKYKGVTKADQTYIAQSMMTGVSMANLTVTGTSGTGIYMRALRFCNFRSIVVSQCAYNLQLINSGDIGLDSFITMNSTIGTSVTIQNSVDVFISNYDILNSSGNGVEISGTSDNITFTSGAVSTNSGHGIVVKDTASNINIIDGNIRQNNLIGIYVEIAASNIIIDGCTIIKNTTGLSLQGTDSLASSCNIYDNVTGAILSSDNSLENCIVESSSGNGVDVAGDNCILTSNRIKDSGDIGLYVTGNDNIISNNRIYNNTGNGVQLDNTANNNILTSNNFKGNTGTNYLDNGVNTQNSTNLSS
jgi:parallel beta-helix repeat protein